MLLERLLPLSLTLAGVHLQWVLNLKEHEDKHPGDNSVASWVKIATEDLRIGQVVLSLFIQNKMLFVLMIKVTEDHWKV